MFAEYPSGFPVYEANPGRHGLWASSSHAEPRGMRGNRASVHRYTTQPTSTRPPSRITPLVPRRRADRWEDRSLLHVPRAAGGREASASQGGNRVTKHSPGMFWWPLRRRWRSSAGSGLLKQERPPTTASWLACNSRSEQHLVAHIRQYAWLDQASICADMGGQERSMILPFGSSSTHPSGERCRSRERLRRSG